MSNKKDTTIAVNRKAKFEYAIEQELMAGIILEGWEVKSLRAGKANIAESYVLIKNGEAWLFGGLITPLITVSTHKVVDPQRTRKLLLNRLEIERLESKVNQKGFTIIPLKLFWHQGHVKLSIALAKGKKLHDKRATMKDRDWNRDKQRILKNHSR